MGAEEIDQTWDKAWRAGHRCGYVDAIGEVYQIMHELPNTDPRFALLVEIADELRDRRDRVLEH
jgi:hypothetical protein